MRVRITETLVRIVDIPDATTSNEALARVDSMYTGCEIVLDAGDFVGVTFEAEKEVGQFGHVNPKDLA